MTSRVQGFAVLSLLALLLGCGTATTVIYEEGRRPERNLMALGPPWLLVTKADVERLDHLDEYGLVGNMRELCSLHDQQVELARKSQPPSSGGGTPSVQIPFLWQNVEELRWALILRGDPALDEVIMNLREIDLKEKAFLRQLARTLSKWRSEKATAALIDIAAELAARPDVGRKTMHVMVAAIMYGRFGEENLGAFVHGERVTKLRDVVLRLVELGGDPYHCRFFNGRFPGQAIDLDAIGGPHVPAASQPAPQSPDA